ncbi:MAG: 50S ribosomal protein L18e [Thermoproteus sp.]
MPPNPTGPTNIQLRMLIRFLKKAAKSNDAPIWAYVAELLGKPRRQRVAVNLAKLNKLVNDGDVVVIPGKLLGYGDLQKKVTIAAVGASRRAVEVVLKSGGQLVSIPELVKKNPRGSNVKVII